MWQFKKLPPRTGSRGGEIRVPGSSPRYSTDDLLPERLSSPGLVRRLLLVFPLSSRDYLALHLSAALLDYRPSRSTQFRMTRPPLSLSLIPFSCWSILLLRPSNDARAASRASIHRSTCCYFHACLLGRNNVSPKVGTNH